MNPTRPNQTQIHSEVHRSYNDIASLTHAYNDEIKYSGETSDNFDNKFNIMDYCTRFGNPYQALHNAFPCMLQGIALTFYYNKYRGPEYQRYNLNRWNEITFQDINDSNTDKNPIEQITILLITLDKIQKTLSTEWQSEAIMHNKIKGHDFYL
ncbi:hypothetical protein OnM2_076012 [Erysiphe neolycopersici]|uniref:Uncharacterized protein n=1 Tax=Erysiphe neolycopersici TaxID=212602 RepID=A0A420HIB8_9PEZI|nr:hypothetical protein OnM2_076012 [Erysiphe neolycopersici]